MSDTSSSPDIEPALVSCEQYRVGLSEEAGVFDRKDRHPVSKYNQLSVQDGKFLLRLCFSVVRPKNEG
jgi:hypothetical protein